MDDAATKDPVRERLLGELARAPSPTRQQRRVRNALLLASAVIVPLLLWWRDGGMRLQSRPLWFVLGTALGWFVVAGWAVWGSVSPGRAMLGPNRRVLNIVVVATPSLMFLWMVAWDLIDAARMAPWPGRWGKLCLQETLLLGAWPLVALLLLRRGSDPVHPGARGAAIGAAVGCATGGLVDMWCPIADPSHILLGHLLPLAILSAAGLVLGRWLLAAGRRFMARRDAKKGA